MMNWEYRNLVGGFDTTQVNSIEKKDTSIWKEMNQTVPWQMKWLNQENKTIM